MESLTVKDNKGVLRTFWIETRLDPMGLFITAEEKNDYGYVFAVHGELDCDQTALMNKLIDKINKGVSLSYIECRTFQD
ncbi:hypothetical protein [Halobacillus sp. Marseille-Q1614]|uniref:DUF7686 domain-containing protein n=1 Tax=Halobacillus sp. Marseille-Q1614 TaxID=2709134 RepID=UPI001570C0AF|nr:hypothetical protein [Halobacillus sp. Marseille-Q1614]